MVDIYETIKYSLQGYMFISTPVCRVPSKVYQGLAGRGRITSFSQSSASRMRRYLRTCEADYQYFITLTYPFCYETDGKKSKQHLKVFIQRLKRYQQGVYHDVDWSAFWFMEFQQRGAIHYHLFTTSGLPIKVLSRIWYEICGTDDQRHLASGTNISKIRSGRHGMCSYVSKYASKAEQKEIPDNILNAGRFWGVSGLRVSVAADILLSWHDRVDRDVIRVKDDLKRALISLVKDDKARKISGKGGSLIITIRNKGDIAMIQHKMTSLEQIVILKDAGFVLEEPHHDIRCQ